MDRDRNFVPRPREEESYWNRGFSQNDELHRDGHYRHEDDQFDSNNQRSYTRYDNQGRRDAGDQSRHDAWDQRGYDAEDQRRYARDQSRHDAGDQRRHDVGDQRRYDVGDQRRHDAWNQRGHPTGDQDYSNNGNGDENQRYEKPGIIDSRSPVGDRDRNDRLDKPYSLQSQDVRSRPGRSDDDNGYIDLNRYVDRNEDDDYLTPIGEELSGLLNRRNKDFVDGRYKDEYSEHQSKHHDDDIRIQPRSEYKSHIPKDTPTEDRFDFDHHDRSNRQERAPSPREDQFYNRHDSAERDFSRHNDHVRHDAHKHRRHRDNDTMIEMQNFRGEHGRFHPKSDADYIDFEAPNPRGQHHGEFPNKPGYQNTGYYDDEVPDYDNQYDDLDGRPHNNRHYYADHYDDRGVILPSQRLSRAVSMRRRSKKKSRRERRLEREEEIPITFVDGMKTLIQRRKTLRQRRPLSEIGAKSELGAKSEFGGKSVLGRRSVFFDYDSDEENKLPSNRNLKKTKSLKHKLITLQKDRNATTHDMATLLRDQVLQQEPSALKGWNLMKYKWSMKWVHFKNWCKNLIYELELWSGAFKIIEGHFGTSTVSYFRFLRWLMFLNIFMSVFVLGIILIPFLLLPPQGMGTFNSTVGNYCASNYTYLAVYYSANYTAHVDYDVKTSSLGQKFRDVLQGTGLFENTVLFYGSYYNKTGLIPIDNPAPYNMALAYLFGVGVSFLLSFVLLVKNSAKGLKQSAVAGSSGSVSMYCNKIFGAWDYCISQQNTSKLKHKSILQEVKNELQYQRFQWKKASRTTKEKLKLYLIRIAINFLVIAILGGSLYLIYYTNQQLVNLLLTTSLSSVVQLMVQFLPSVTLMFLGVIVPTIFNKVVIAEDYMPAFAIRITLIRTVLLRLASLGMLMISLYTTSIPKQSKTGVGISCNDIQYPQPTTETMLGQTNGTESKIQCWETYVGQQIYKLVILNFLVVVGSTYGWEFPRKLLYTKFHEKVKVLDLLGQQTFDLSKSVLDLVYLQTLCWLGMFFSPILPVMCAVTLFLFFYIKKVGY
ncbi:Transmembrane channel-like protein 5 [Mactra antiquata]